MVAVGTINDGEWATPSVGSYDFIAYKVDGDGNLLWKWQVNCCIGVLHGRHGITDYARLSAPSLAFIPVRYCFYHFRVNFSTLHHRSYGASTEQMFRVRVALHNQLSYFGTPCLIQSFYEALLKQVRQDVLFSIRSRESNARFADDIPNLTPYLL